MISSQIRTVQALVDQKADELSIRNALGPPSFVATPGFRDPRGHELAAMWPMPADEASTIRQKAQHWPRTLVYDGALIKFVFLDERGRAVECAFANN